MNKKVTLVAHGIDVTADNRDQALRYLQEDAREFQKNFNYDMTGLKDTDDPLSGFHDIAIEARITESAKRGDQSWVGCAIYHVVVASNGEGAPAERAINHLRATPDRPAVNIQNRKG